MTCVEIGDGDGRLKMYVKVAWLGFDTRIRQFTKGLSVTSSWVNVVYLNINYCLNFSSSSAARGGSRRGGGGGRGGGSGGRGGRGEQRWWDPVWRAERLRQQQAEVNSNAKFKTK